MISTCIYVNLFTGILSSSVNVIIATLHGDCHLVSEVSMLKNHSDLWLTVSTTDFKCTKFNKRHNKGKLEQKLYDLVIENFEVKSATTSSSLTKIEKTKVQDETMPSSTFNLQLSEKEREDRSKLELPYWKADKKDSKIEYIPDDNDDWDDEDPDDDLDV